MPRHPANAQLRSWIALPLTLLATLWIAACGQIQVSGTPGTTLSGGIAMAPAITAQPQNVSASAGQSATFSVAVSGTEPFTYQWTINAAAISGATSLSYTTPALQISDSGEKYSVIVSNSAGSTVSSPATLTVSGSSAVLVPPMIVTQPQSQTVTDGSTATFTVVATGSAPLQYQWVMNGTPVGSNSPTYTTPTLTLANSGEAFGVIVSNASSSTARSNPVTLTVTPIAASITSQPVSQAVPLGNTATFTVTATGSQPFSYQWYQYGVAISGATSASYTTPATAASDSGSIFTVTVTNPANTPVTSAPATLLVNHTLALMAGALGGIGHTNATGANATFYNPQAVATDPAGNTYVIDQVNQIVREVTPAGVVTTLAGTPGVVGSADGTGPTASFNFSNLLPGGIAYDPTSGNLYVSDTNNNTIRKITPATGAVVTPAGTALVNGYADAFGPAAQFSAPNGLAVDAVGNLYIADSGNSVIRMMTPGRVVTTVAGTPGTYGAADGTGTAAQFAAPTGVSFDPISSNLYVADYLNGTVRQIAPGGVVTTLAGTAGMFGAANGIAGAASFNGLLGVAVDSTGQNLYVADAGNLTIRKVTLPGAAVSTFAGTALNYGSADGTGAAASFAFPAALAIDPSGNILVGDGANNEIRKVTTPGAVVTTLAGNIGGRGYADGTSGANSTARFNLPQNLVGDGAGNLYVSDQYNEVIRKISAAGAVTTVAGSVGVIGAANGTGSAASFNAPFAMVIDSHNNLYVADSGNNTIRMITPAGVVTTLAGTAGVVGAANGIGAAASFNAPFGLGIDANDTLYVADYGNNVIRKVTTPAGMVSTFVGTAGVQGYADGTGATAQFNGPIGISLNLATGNAYVADRYNDTIRMITPAGVVTTIAGSPGQNDYVEGTGAAAHFSWPATTAVDPATGNVYVADYLHNAVRLIAAGNVVSTVVGQPAPAGALGAVLGSLPAALSGPSSIVVVNGPALELIICDAIENSVLLATLP